MMPLVNPIALRKAKIVYNFGLSECNRVDQISSFEAYCTKKKTAIFYWENAELLQCKAPHLCKTISTIDFMYTRRLNKAFIKAVLQIIRGNRDNSGIISNISP